VGATGVGAGSAAVAAFSSEGGEDEVSGVAAPGGVEDLFAGGAVGLIAGSSEVLGFRGGSERGTTGFDGAATEGEGPFINPLIRST